MTTYVMRNGRLVDRNRSPPRSSASGAAYVISDEMAETRHMADGKHYTSKAKFRAATRAHGCIEVGNEIPKLLAPRKAPVLDRGRRRDAIRQAIAELQR